MLVRYLVAAMLVIANNLKLIREALLYSLRDIAVLEESRQALGTAEIGRVSEPIGGGWMTYAGPGSWANQACGLGLEGPVTENELDRLVDFYADRSVEPRIEVCPFADETLIVGLSQRGFRLQEFENVLARELTATEDLMALHPHGWPVDLELVHVDPADSGQVRTFAEVSTQGFRAESEPLSGVLAATTIKMVQHSRSDSFLARLRGIDVGGGAMESSAPIACLFGTSVAPAHRRQGIQAALMLRRLECARDHGCSLAVIHSRPGISTERNAQRLQFQLAYTKVVLVMPGQGLRPSL